VAARELPPHPLLTVEAGRDAMVRKIVEHLRAPRPPHGTPGGAADQAGTVRSWDTVAGEYLAEVLAAVAASSPAGDLSGTARQL